MKDFLVLDVSVNKFNKRHLIFVFLFLFMINIINAQEVHKYGADNNIKPLNGNKAAGRQKGTIIVDLILWRP